MPPTPLGAVVSGRFFLGLDSGLRRSTRLPGEAMTNSNSYVSQVVGNGTNHSSSKFLGGISLSSKMNSTASCSVTNRKGQQWTPENLEEGRRSQGFDDMLMDNIATTSSSASSFVPTFADGRYTDQDRGNFQMAGTLHNSRVVKWHSEIVEPPKGSWRRL